MLHAAGDDVRLVHAEVMLATAHDERAQAAACLDGAGPAVLGRIASSGVPVIIGLVSGALALLTMAADLAFTGAAGQRYFSAALTVSIALIVLAYLFVFPAFVALRLRRPELERPFRVPGGAVVAWAVSIMATGWSLLAALCLLWPGLGTGDQDAALPAGFEGERLQFELLVLAPIVLVLGLACVFYRLGRATADS
jgi:amino acid transporter